MAGASRRVESDGSQTDELLLALRDVDRALTLDSENVEAKNLKATIEAALAALREAARLKTAINNARTRFANGKHQAAIRLLEDYQPSPNPEIEAVLTEFRGVLAKLEEERRAERERIEKQERLATLLESARTALRECRFDAALDDLSNAGRIDAAAPEVGSLRDRVLREQEAARLNAEVERMVADLDNRLAAGDITAARALVESVETQAQTDTRVQLARQRVEEAMAARAAAEALEREAEAQCTAARASFEKGDVDEASRLSALALAANPQHAGAQALSSRVAAALEERAAAEAARRRRETIDELVAAAATHLQDADVQGDHATLAAQKIEAALALDPSHAEALALKAAAEAAMAAQRRARAAIRNARNRVSLGKHRAAIQLLENLEAELRPLVADVLNELRNALSEIEERQRREKEAVGDATVFIPPPAVLVDYSLTRSPDTTAGRRWLIARTR